MASSPAFTAPAAPVRPRGGGLSLLRGPQGRGARAPELLQPTLWAPAEPGPGGPGPQGPTPRPDGAEVSPSRPGGAAGLAPGPGNVEGPAPGPGGAEGLRPAPRALEDLHPALWRAHQLGRTQQAVLASGFAELDAQLPGGGWPAGVITELLLPHPGIGELRLLAPALAALQGQQRGVIWFDPPAAPCAWALSALGLDLRQLVVVHARQGLKQQRARERLPAADVLWALEQALKSGHLGAVLAWLPARLPADALRRLQLAAQAHAGPAFLLRGDEARLRPSAAPLRVGLASAGPDRLRVLLLKRRGPPLAQPITLSLPPVLSPSARALAEARALRGDPRPGVVVGPRAQHA